MVRVPHRPSLCFARFASPREANPERGKGMAVAHLNLMVSSYTTGLEQVPNVRWLRKTALSWLGYTVPAAMLAGLCLAQSAGVASPSLTGSVRSTSQFKFTLNGDAGAPYIIETSTNLATWSAVATNVDPATTRPIVVSASDPQSFFRARTAIPLVAFAVAAAREVNLSGNNLRADSFDSADPSYNTNGRYDLTKAKDGGDIGVGTVVTNTLGIGNANIFGHVSTGPNGTIAIGVNGMVGDKTFQSDSANKGKIEPGWSSDDMKVDFPDVSLPYLPATGLTPAAGVVNGVTYAYVLSTGKWALFSGSFHGKVLVTGTADLYIGPGAAIKFSGSDVISIQPNASLNLYANTAIADISGQGVQNPGRASQFFYWGMTNNTNLAYGGNSSFTGVFYAPYADFSLGGGGTSPIDFSGSCVAKSIKLNGNYSLHFDEDLKRAGPFH